MNRRLTFLLVVLCALTLSAVGQPLTKSAIQVDPGSTKQTGATFAYRLTYNCSSTSGPCLNAEVVDLLPIEVQQVSTVPASPTGDVAAINVTPNFMGSGRTRVQFVMITPLPAGNSGDLLINVRFPNGSTPDGTVAVNTADAINLGASPGTFTTPPVNVTAVATVQVTTVKTLTTSPANLDLPETYRLRTSVANSNGALSLTSIGPIVDTLPPGTVFSGATPAADCQPGCVGTTPATVTWTSPCSVPLNPGQNCDIFVNVVFPSGTFPSGTNVTNSFAVDATPLGEPPQSFGPGQLTHTVTTFVPSPSAGLSKNMAGNTPNPPTLNQTFSFDLNVSNSGNVPLDNLVVIDTLPVEMLVSSVTTGAYTNLTDFAVGEGVRVSYEKNTALGVFTLWGSSPATTTNTTLNAPPPGLGAGEYLTRIRWEYGQAAVGMSSSTRPIITGQIINPDNAGGPVAFGDTIQNCAALNAVYTAGPTNVNQSDCQSFVLSGSFAQLNPAKENLSGGGPFNPGQNVSWRLRVRSASQSSDSLPLEDITVSDLLPADLLFSTWTFDDQSTGLPAPQNFSQVPNFAGTGRTLLRWTWNAGSGNLAPNQQVWINISTTIRNGALFGSLSNDVLLDPDAAGLGQRCSGSSQADTLDYDGDGDTAETLCRATGSINVAGIAQLVSSMTIHGTCDGGAVSSSAGTLIGGGIEYHLRVQNVGTVPMQNFVLIDILPFVGDTGVRDTNPRGSQWTPLLAAPIVPPPGTTLYYSTSGNPCRGEVGGPVVSCDPPNWTTVAPMPITSARSFKLEFGDRVVNPFDFVEFTFIMTTLGDVPPAATAYNSFAYQADRGDGLGSLAAEPQKVGIAIGACEAASLGDFVWVDTNDNGIQDDGPTGINGVFVRLFTPGPDTIPGTLDDVPLASTITGNGPDSAPGWYSFPGLAPGDYVVRITPPPSYELSTRDQGSDAADSDGDANASSHVVTLSVDEDDPTIDFGLVPTALGAAGNYVWFDRNSDGIQNEATTDGANGVTVRLYLDDGDGNREPGGDDPLAATTVTANDVYGRPGYYLFDGLAPGLPYFIQFVDPAVATSLTTQDAGGDDTTDSDARLSDGTGPVFTVAPLELNPTFDAGFITATGTLSLGDQVWADADNDGIFEPQNGELGIDEVRLDLYRDINNDGEPTLDEYLDTTTTATTSGFAGRYLFDDLAPGTYIVVVAPENFNGGGALAGLSTSTGNDPAPDPDDDVNGDDNGTDIGALTASRPVTLSDNGEPTAEDGNNDSNLTVDFGFITAGDPPDFDYGDAPDVGAGTANGDYQTTALDTGARHLLGVTNAPYLGACVDSDGGFLQNTSADADDITAGTPVGTCAGTDDEDGVVFSGAFTPGSTASFSVTAGGPTACTLDAWVDWNQNGDFGDSGEQIATSQTIPTGAPTVLTPVVPAGAIPGSTYARFRCSTAGGLTPSGPAADGEVEDYLIGIIGHDAGDAPASYGTQGAGRAQHVITPGTGLTLGSCVDTEPDGQPSVGANGDDTNAGTSRVGSCFDDEDGVIFDGAVVTCTTLDITVNAGAAGLLDAWIDYNRDGDFGDAGEQIFISQSLVAGLNGLSTVVPCAATGGASYARFRLSSAGGLAPAGDAADGEVEDYAVTIEVLDFGDAPDSYGTTIGADGARHVVVPGYSLGATIDSEANGQPNVGATGDGADEDGVTMPATLIACSSVNIPVTVTNTAAVNARLLDAWIDFDGNGTFDAGDRIATGLALAAGANNVAVNVPCSTVTAASYARFRLSNQGVSGPDGLSDDGEIEDYAVALQGLDFGDAADPTYPTLLASNGARHAVLPSNNPHLGASVDTEADGAPNAGANGDDSAGTDDENGVTYGPLIPGETGSVTIVAGSTGGLVNHWIDLNRDGDWSDIGEQIVTEQVFAAGSSQDFTFLVPADTTPGGTVSRTRISSQSALGVTGAASDGEIEDHLVNILAPGPRIGVALNIVSSVYAGPCGVYDVTFDVLLRNLGNTTLNNVQATTPLATVFVPPAVYSITSITSGDLAVNPAYDGDAVQTMLLPGATLSAGQSATLRVVLHLNATCQVITYPLSTIGTGEPPSGPPVSDTSQNGTDTDPDNDGDPTDNNEPSPVEVVIVAFQAIPTLDEWALIALALLVAAIAWRRMS